MSNIKDLDVKQMAEEYFGLALPHFILNNLHAYNRIKYIDYIINKAFSSSDPFFGIQKLILLSKEPSALKNGCIFQGIVTPLDTEGLYRKTISLSLCTEIIVFASSVYLSILFPDLFSKAVRIREINLLDHEHDRPVNESSIFYIEISITNREKDLLSLDASLSFSNTHFASINRLDIILFPKDPVG